MRGYFITFILVGISLFASQAEAEAPNRAALEKVAKKACMTGDFRKGSEILSELYIETNDPTYLYNQGRCYQQNHQNREAIDRFREYLRKVPGISDKDKAETEKHIAECKANLKEDGLENPAPNVPSSPPAIQAQPVLVIEQPASPQRTEPATMGSGSGLRTLGVVTGVFGLAAVGVGGFCYLKTQSLTDQLNRPDGWDQGKATSRDSYERLGYISFGVGAAALVTGTTLYLLGRPEQKPAEEGPAVSIFPTFGEGSARLFLRGTY